MRTEEIRQKCKAAQILERDSITLIVPGRWGTETHKRLFGKYGGPKGVIHAEHPNGCVCSFKVYEILAVLDEANL